MSASAYKRVFSNNQSSTFNDGCDYEVTRFSLTEYSTESDNEVQVKSDLLYSGYSPIKANSYYNTVSNFATESEQIADLNLGTITAVSTATGVYGHHIGIGTQIGTSGQNSGAPVAGIKGTQIAITNSHTGNNSPFQYTTDGGVNWTTASGDSIIGYNTYMWATNGSDKIATLSNYSNSTMYATFSGGVPTSATTAQSHSAIAGGISNNLLLMGKSNEIYRSTTWTPPGTLVASITGSPYAMSISSGSDTTATCLAFIYNGTLYRSTDGGQNWSQVSPTSLPNFNFSGVGNRSCVWHSETSKFYVLNHVAGKATIYSSSDGLTWEMLSQTAYGGSPAFSRLQSENGYLIGIGSKIWQSVDGYVWSRLSGTSFFDRNFAYGSSGYTNFDGTGYYAEASTGGNGRSHEYGEYGTYTEITTDTNSNYSYLTLSSSQQAKRSDATGSPPSIVGDIQLVNTPDNKIYLQNPSGAWGTSYSGTSLVTSAGFNGAYVGLKVGSPFSSGYIRETNIPDLSAFTYDLLFRFNSASDTSKTLIDTRNSTNTTGFYVEIDGSSILKIYSADGLSSNTLLSPIDTEWHHLRITPSTSYIDNTSISHGFTVSSGSRISIARNWSNSNILQVKISNFRLVQKTLSSPGENYLRNLLSTSTKSYPAIKPVNY